LRVETARQGNERIEDLVDTIVEELDERAEAVAEELERQKKASGVPVTEIPCPADTKAVGALRASPHGRRCAPQEHKLTMLEAEELAALHRRGGGGGGRMGAQVRRLIDAPCPLFASHGASI
jgi:hypothetical protein